ncbi:MAG: dTDP-4-dehydrorhamnose reductase [bacterium]
MRILVTGAKGQLGNELLEILQNEEVTGASKEELNIVDAEAVHAYIAALRPEAVIHAAAYTKVDDCEKNVDLAYQVNAVGAQNIASACLKCGAKMVYVSTDFVFDGKKQEPYLEFDQPNPLNIYGKSKLAGERLVSAILNRFFIVRTSWLYGIKGNNFVKTILKLGQERDELQVVADQWGTPTYARDLAAFIIKLIKTDNYGVYHASNKGMTNWYEFAKAILAGYGITTPVVPITAAELNRPAVRPAYSVMRNYMQELTIGDEMPEWQDSLHEYLQKVKKNC